MNVRLFLAATAFACIETPPLSGLRGRLCDLDCQPAAVQLPVARLIHGAGVDVYALDAASPGHANRRGLRPADAGAAQRPTAGTVPVKCADAGGAPPDRLRAEAVLLFV